MRSIFAAPWSRLSKPREGGWEIMLGQPDWCGRNGLRGRITLGDDSSAQIRALAAGSDQLEAEVRNTIVRALPAEGQQVLGGREILDLTEAFTRVTNSAESHTRRAA